MDRQGSILIVDDLPKWCEQLVEILQNNGFHADAVSTVAEASDRLNVTLYHILVLDIRMDRHNPSNKEGINFLEELDKRGLSEATKVIILSAYGTLERMRIAFRDYKVADFLSKDKFSKQVFLESVRRIFSKEVNINLALQILWQQISGPEQVVVNLEVNGTSVRSGTDLQEGIAAELEDLLCRLFHRAKSVLVRPLTQVHGGTGVLRVQPFYTGGSGQEVVVKFGDFHKVEEEYSNFKEYVQPFLGGGRNTTVLDFRRTPHLGGIIYSLLGTINDQLVDFGDFYRRSDRPQIIEVLDRLFRDTCGVWYANRGHLEPLNLTADYQRLLEYPLEMLEQVVSEQLKSVQGKQRLYFNHLKGKRTFANPFLAMKELSLTLPTYLCITNGAFSPHNLLVDSSRHVWMIDFQEASQSHILRDVAILDSAIRFQLLATEEATLIERLHMEEALCSIERFSQVKQLPTKFSTTNQALSKAYATVVHLRTVAYRLVDQNPKDDMSEYYIALLYNALYTLQFSSLSSGQRVHALLSASLLADRLGLEAQDEAWLDRHINELRAAINNQSFRNYKGYKEALAAYEQIIRLNPQNAVAYYSKSVVLKNLKQYEAALEAYKQATLLDPDLEITDLDTTESPRSLLIRVQSMQQFLMEAGFEFDIISNRIGFMAFAKVDTWHERFPRGLYIRMLFDDPLDQNAVQSIFRDAKDYTDFALVIINQPPKGSGWMAMGGLRAEENDRFVFLPIEETLIKQGIALKKEHQTLSVYIDKHLGKDFNPYDVRDPVSDAVSFFGRESLTEEILNALKLGQSLGLFGLHKMGKSSLLKKLQKKAEFPAAYVCLAEGDKLDRIYNRILRDWAIDTRIKYPTLKWSSPSFTGKKDPKMLFDTSANKLLLLLGSVTNTPLLAIFLDEIEKITPYKDGDEATLQLYINLMDSLRRLQQETYSISLLVAGVHPVVARRNYFWGNQKNPMYQVISERFLLPLDRDDCIHMIRSLGQQINLEYSDESLETIVQMSGAHPFLARQVCSLAYKNQGNIDTFSIEYLHKITQDFVSNPATASYFDDHGLWAELGKQDIWGEAVSYANYKILSSLAASSGKLAETEICAGLDKQTAKRALNGLKERGVISSSNEDNFYYITIGLFHNWIRLHKLGME